MNADGEPIYDPLKDLELATAKVCSLFCISLAIQVRLLCARLLAICEAAMREVKREVKGDLPSPDGAYILQVAEVAGQAAMKVSTKVGMEARLQGLSEHTSLLYISSSSESKV